MATVIKTKYIELIKECADAIKYGECLGCQGLENSNYQGNPNCEVHKKFKTNEGEQLKI